MSETTWQKSFSKRSTQKQDNLVVLNTMDLIMSLTKDMAMEKEVKHIMVGQGDILLIRMLTI